MNQKNISKTKTFINNQEHIITRGEHTMTNTKKIELSFEEFKKLEWSDRLFENLDETFEELEQEKPYFWFFKNGDAEIVYSKDSKNIGFQGVEGDEWESFLEELNEKGIPFVKVVKEYKGWK